MRPKEFRRILVTASWLYLLAVVISTAAYANEAQSDVPRLESSACATDALKQLDAECYTFHGQENWEAPNGHEIELPVGVIKAEKASANDNATPVVFFPGGPGYSVLEHGDYLAQLRKDIDHRTLIVFDPRGFNHATPALKCPDYAKVSPYHNVIHTPALTSSLDPLERMTYITDAVSNCYQKLDSQGIEVSQYTERATSRDVDEIRRLLGLDTINIYGSSTGSGTTLSYIRYYPDSVRAAILGWPWYTSLRNRAPLDEFYTLKRKFTDVLALCVEQDEQCREQIPAWFLAIDRTRRALDDRPFTAQVTAEDGTRKTLYFDGAAFLDTLYLMLPQEYAELPRIVTQVQDGDYSALPKFFQIDQYDNDPEAPSYALGAFLAQACNDMGTNRPKKKDSIAAVKREPATIGFEPIWLCAWWGTDGDVPSEHSDPVQSDIPALTIHGQMDPCCGMRWGNELSKTMPNVQSIEIQGKGHNPITECRSTVIDAFLSKPYTEVDKSCQGEVPLKPWQLE